MSVGHRLRILKSIYNLSEVQEIQVGPDRYIPPTVICLQEEEIFRNTAAATGSLASSSGRFSKLPTEHVNLSSRSGSLTLDALPHLLKLFEVRDERMSVVETEIRRLADNYSRLREELLPMFRLFKESKPLPMPLDGQLLSPSQNPSQHNSNNNLASLSPPLSAESVAFSSSNSNNKYNSQSSLGKVSSRPMSVSNQRHNSSAHSSNNNSVQLNSPTRTSNYNSTDWIDTSAFYEGGNSDAQNSGTLTQPISLSSYAPSNNVVTTTLTTSDPDPSPSYSLGTPSTSGVLTSGSGSSNHSFLPESSSSNSEDCDNFAESNPDTKLYTKLISTSSSSLSSAPVSASKKMFPSSSQQTLGGQLFSSSTAHVKPPLSHTNSLPHPGSHDDHDLSGSMPKDYRLLNNSGYMGLASSSAGRSNPTMSTYSATQNNNSQRSGSSNSHYTNNNSNNSIGNNSNNNSSSSNTGGTNNNYDKEFSSINSSAGSSSSGISNLLNGMNNVSSLGNIPHRPHLVSKLSSSTIPSVNMSSSSSNQNITNNSTNTNSIISINSINNNNNKGSLSNANSSSASSILSTHRTSDPIKDFNIPPDVPCYKVLPKIAKKHKVRGDVCELVVCYDDQERMVGLDEFPLKIFKELQARGKNPVFMIRESAGVKAGVGFVVNGTPGGLL